MKKWKKSCSIIMATAVLTSVLPMGYSAKAEKKGNDEVTKETTFNQLLKETKAQVNAKDLEEGTYVDGESIVMYYSDQSAGNNPNLFGKDTKIEETWSFFDLESEESRTLIVSRVSSASMNTKQLIEYLLQNESILTAEPNYILERNSNAIKGIYGDYQWAIDNKGQNNGTEGCDINPEKIWKQTTGKEKVIAVLDTGVDYTHEDLKDNMWINPYRKNLKGVYGYDFVNEDSNPMDDNGHGTHCAGIIAATGKGVTGVSSNSKIMALKVLDEEGQGDIANVIEAYQYIDNALKLGVDIVAINDSWEIWRPSTILDFLINLVGKKGAITVNSVANNGNDMEGGRQYTWGTPSDYRIAVTASTEDDELETYADFSSVLVDLAAPGTNILSTVPTDTYNPTIHGDNKEYSELYLDFNQAFPISAIKTFQSCNSGKVEMSISNQANFGLKNVAGSALCMKVTVKGPGEYGFYVPINLPESSTDYYASASIKIQLDNGDGSKYVLPSVGYGIDKLAKLKKGSQNSIADLNCANVKAIPAKAAYWTVVSEDTNLREASGTEDAIWFALSAEEAGEYSIFIDNVGFSKKDMDKREFGKYAFCSGTSMAAPYVTGAVALIKECYPTLPSKELRNLVAKTVRKVPCMEDKVISGGILDLSKIICYLQ